MTLLMILLMILSIWLATKMGNWIDHYEEQETKTFVKDIYKIWNENVDNTTYYSTWDFVSDEDKECIKIINGYDILPSRHWSTKDAAIDDADDIINDLNHIKKCLEE